LPNRASALRLAVLFGFERAALTLRHHANLDTSYGLFPTLGHLEIPVAGLGLTVVLIRGFWTGCSAHSLASSGKSAYDSNSTRGRRADSIAGEGERSPDTATEAQTKADRQADTGVRQSKSLIELEQAESYNGRWKELKGDFVDDPRRAVRGANELVGEVLDELEELFRGQRTDLEQRLDNEQTTTEDLR